MYKADVMERFHRALSDRVKSYDHADRNSWTEEATLAFWKHQRAQGEFDLAKLFKEDELISKETFWMCASNFVEGYLIARAKIVEGNTRDGEE